MKFIISSILILMLISCSKKEEVRLKAYSPEAFAYDIGDSWEVNAAVYVKGFRKVSTDDNGLSVSLSYVVDLINPEGKVTKNIFSDSKEVKAGELNDMQLEAQFELDYMSIRGQYKIIFSIVDNNSKDSTSVQAEFKLED